MEVVVSSESAVMAIENPNLNTTKNPSPKEKYAPAIENLDPNTTKNPSPKQKYVPAIMAVENLDPNTTKNPSPKEKHVPAIENLDLKTTKNPSPKGKHAPAITAIQNLDPSTTKIPIPKEKYVPAIRAKSGDEEGMWKEKKILYDGNDYASKKSTNVTRDSHYFQNSWTFWFDNPFAKSSQATWGNSLRSLYTFATIEEFWSVYNNMHSPSIWIPGADLYCFKDKIEPKWEDPICANGGKWTMMVSRVKLESNWLNTLLALVGEQFEQGDEICGAVLNFRARGDKISLWTKNAANEKVQLSIGKQWKELLGCNETIGFIVHEDAKTLDRDAKRRYTV